MILWYKIIILPRFVLKNHIEVSHIIGLLYCIFTNVDAFELAFPTKRDVGNYIYTKINPSIILHVHL